MTPDQAIEKFGIQIKSTFIPFGVSQNFDKKWQSLNWEVELSINQGKVQVGSFPFSSGIAHCPAYKKTWRNPFHKEKAIQHECHYGKSALKTNIDSIFKYGRPILPDINDFIYSLIGDSSVVNYGDFPTWADSFGYNNDSIKALNIYKDCVKTANKMISAFGLKGMADLIEAFENY